MALGINAAIVATSLAATAIVGVASAPIVTEDTAPVGAKADRLPVVAHADGYLTLETRADGVSVLKRVPLD
jgi:hypothetical protein